MFRILLTLSFRSLRSHQITTFIVGSIIFFGTWLGVAGTALLDSLDHSLAKTLISSIAGHLQVYSETARDNLALFGSGFAAVDDVGQMPNFSQVRTVVQKDRNVRAVVPMGIGYHGLLLGNELDGVLGLLGHAARTHDSSRVQVLAREVQDIAHEIETEMQNRAVIAAPSEKLAEHLIAVRRVQSDDFWQALERDPEAQLQYLDNRLAPLAGSSPPLYLRDVGTDLRAFQENFDRFSIVDGQMVPPETRGMLFSKVLYESQLKHPVARTLDEIHRGLTQSARRLDNDAALLEAAARLPEQYKRITFQLSPENARTLRLRLQEFLSVPDATLAGLLQQFLLVNDQNFAQRYLFFYQTIAPMISLYSVRVGDVITLQGMTHAGYKKSTNVRVWGTFQFTGLDGSSFAGAQNLVDLITFRELYGMPDPAQQQELAALRNSAHVVDIHRQDAEAAMFSKSSVRAQRKAFSKPVPIATNLFDEAKNKHRHTAETFTQPELDSGLALNAAVVLKDGNELNRSRADVQHLLREAGLPVKVVDWRTASGLVSRFITVVHLFLYVATSIIFLVALVIMSNAMTMATSERTQEIGTIRAIGGQRHFILVMYFVETLTLGLVAGGLGAFAGFASVKLLGMSGIAATSDLTVFLFSGPKLYPTIRATNLLFGLITVLMVTFISTLYPAQVATRIAPVVAMSPKE